MLEAVSTVLQNAPNARIAADQVSTADSFAANPDRTQRAAPQAPYVSPYIYLDVNYDKAVIQIRNGETGDVEGQFPSQSRLQQQQRAARADQAQQAAPQGENQPTQSAAPQQPQAEQTAAVTTAPTAQQQAAFAAAAQSGNANASTVTVFA